MAEGGRLLVTNNRCITSELCCRLAQWEESFWICHPGFLNCCYEEQRVLCRLRIGNVGRKNNALFLYYGITF